MRIIRASKDLIDTTSSIKRTGKSIGFVPTMGALHEGHFSLINRAVRENDIAIASIFVNPLQFDNPDDLATYPRVIEQDLAFLEDHKVDFVFTPEVSDLYPSKPIVSINFGSLAETLEGRYREGHFEGVGIIVSKLLHLVQPTKAYFGKKDLQQYLLIRRMCEDLSFPYEIVGVDTVREASGLALSSRNRKLSSSGLTTATIIHQGLEIIRKGVAAKQPLEDLMAVAKDLFHRKPDFNLEYLEAVNPENLSSVTSYDTLNELAVCIAGYVEGVRLIDNLYLRLK